jgi:hypothetical protein
MTITNTKYPYLNMGKMNAPNAAYGRESHQEDIKTYNKIHIFIQHSNCYSYRQIYLQHFLVYIEVSTQSLVCVNCMHVEISSHKQLET